MKKRNFLKSAAVAALALSAMGASSIGAAAQEVTLRLHQFLPAQANVPAGILIPWAEKIGTESGGRIKVEVFSAMSLGGTPPQLMDQARDGVVDAVRFLLFEQGQGHVAQVGQRDPAPVLTPAPDHATVLEQERPRRAREHLRVDKG